MTHRAASSSGDAPKPFDKEEGPFNDSWDWNIHVEPLRPGETATCHVMLGVDDNGSLTVDGQGVEIPGEGEYHGGQYREKNESFPIEPGYHKLHMTYENVALPPDWKNLAILDYSVKVEVSGSGSSSSYEPDEGDPEPVDTSDDGVTTTYSYNTARQLVEEIRSEVTDGTTVVTPETITSYTRDALGKITLRKRIIPTINWAAPRRKKIISTHPPPTSRIRTATTAGTNSPLTR